MLRNIIISPLNGIRFVPFNEPQAPLYNSQQFDKAWFIENKKPWEPSNSFYTQPVQNGDPLSLQIQVSKRISLFPYQHPKIELIDCDGKVIKSGVFEQPPGVPAITDQGISYTVEWFKKNNFYSGVPVGTYYLVIRCYFDTQNNGFFDKEEIVISEPLFIRPKHPGTGFLEYSHRSNKDNIIFEQTRQKFSMRIHASLILTPKSDAVVFIDQNKAPATLSGTAFRSWEFIAGGDGNPIPDYRIDQLNHIFVLSNIFYEGKAYSRAEGASLEKDAEMNAPLSLAKIELLEKNNTDAYMVSRGGLSMLSPIPAFPFEIYKTEIGYQGQADFHYLYPERIENTFQLNNYVTGQNTLIVNAGLTGTVVIENNEMVYNRGLGESYDYAKAFVLPYRIGIRCTTIGVSTVNTQIGMRSFSGFSRYSIYTPGNPIPLSGEANSVINTNILATYTSAGGFVTQTIDLYHDGTLDYLALEGIRVSGITRYTDSSLPQLRYFVITGSTALTTFHIWNELKVIRATLMELNIYNNINLTNVGAYWVNDGSGPAWWALTQINLAGNKLSSTTIDDLYLNMRYCGGEGAMNIGGMMFTYVQAAGGGAATINSALARLWLTNNYNWSFFI